MPDRDYLKKKKCDGSRLRYNARMTGLTIAGRTFGSRLLVGTGKFSSNQAMAECLEARAGPRS